MPSSLRELRTLAVRLFVVVGLMSSGLGCSSGDINNPIGVQRSLDVVAAGAGDGSVSSSPEGISCTISNGQASGSCRTDFEVGTPVTLTGSASPGSEHLGWTGACEGRSCTLRLNESSEVRAHFEPEEAPQPTIGLSSSSLTFTAEEGSNPSSQTLTVTNDGPGTLSWGRSTSEPSWLFAEVVGSPRGLGSGESQAIDVRVGSDTLASGSYSGTIRVSAPGATNDPQMVQVSLTVTEPPPKPLTVEGAGAGQGAVTSNPAGVACQISGGNESGACEVDFPHGTGVTLTADPAAESTFEGWSGPCSGTGTCEVTMDQARTVGAAFELAPASEPTIGLSPTSLTFTAEQGSNPNPQIQALTVTNTGSGTLNWSRTSSEPSWLFAEVGGAPRALAAGESQAIEVRVQSAALASGAYSGTITVSASGATNNPQTVEVSLTVTELPPQQLTVEGSGTGGGTVTSNPAGIACQISNGNESGACQVDFPSGQGVTLTADPAAGSTFEGWSGPCGGTGTCEVTMDQARTVRATFDLAAADDPTIGLSPATLTFTAEQGSNPNPQIQTVTVTNTGSGTLNWNRSSSEPSWLFPEVGGAPRALAAGESQAIEVRVVSASLAVGTYSGTVTVSAPGATNNPQTVEVSLTVTAPPQSH